MVARAFDGLDQKQTADTLEDLSVSTEEAEACQGQGGAFSNC